MDRRRARLGLLGLVVAEAGAVVLLHRLGSVDGLGVPWDSIPDWLDTAPPEEVLAAIVRVVALATAWWLLASTLVYVVVSAAGAPRAAHRIALGTLPLARRLTQRALMASVVAGAALGIRPVGAAPPPSTGPPPSPPGVVFEIDHREPEPAGAVPTTSPSGRSGRAGGLESAPPVAPLVAPPVAPPAAVAPAPAPPPSAAPSANGMVYVVVAGDSLWSIAAEHLAQVTGRTSADVDDREIATYWTAVVEANLSLLRSGDPNLIFPGELLDLPPVAA